MPVTPGVAVTIPAGTPFFRITDVSFRTVRTSLHNNVVNGQGARKSRHGEARDLLLNFDRKLQRFAVSESVWTAKLGRKRDNGKLHSTPPSLLETEPAGARQRRGRSASEGRDPPARRRITKRASGLRFEILNAFADRGRADLSRGELAVWLILYRDTRRDGTARTSLDDLVRRGGMNRQTASRAVGELVRWRMLQALSRGGLNQGSSSYRVFPFPMEK
jgi:hypothetical protein